jgi:hypothetical protein
MHKEHTNPRAHHCFNGTLLRRTGDVDGADAGGYWYAPHRLYCHVLWLRREGTHRVYPTEKSGAESHQAPIMELYDTCYLGWGNL